MVALVPYAVVLAVAFGCWSWAQRQARWRPKLAALISFAVVMAVLYLTILTLALLAIPADFHAG